LRPVAPNDERGIFVAREEWGEERLIELAKTYHGLSALEVVRHILGAAQAFAAGNPQHDDMTLVVLRVTS
jgi:sigma-B regulation protein RsbU (phosphoserine phosphatase)